MWLPGGLSPRAGMCAFRGTTHRNQRVERDTGGHCRERRLTTSSRFDSSMHASHLRIHDSVPFTEGNEGNQGSCSLFFVHLSPTESHWFLSPPFRVFRVFRGCPTDLEKSPHITIRSLCVSSRPSVENTTRLAQTRFSTEARKGPQGRNNASRPLLYSQTANPFTHPHTHTGPLISDL